MPAEYKTAPEHLYDEAGCGRAQYADLADLMAMLNIAGGSVWRSSIKDSGSKL
jgi:hypothetical protein